MSDKSKETTSKSNTKDKEKDKKSGESVDEAPPIAGTSKEADKKPMEVLEKLLSKLNFLGKDKTSGETELKILDEFSLDGIVSYIKKENCKKIITLAGAGISTSAGIPDFRSPGSGLYHNLQKYNLPHPQAIFEMGFFNENPKPFFELAKELYPGSFKPTPCHYFIKLLYDKGLLLRHYTQNIDTLERIAGIPEEKLVEAHGTFYTGHCLKCRKEYSLEWMKEIIFKDEVPHCDSTSCKGVVKPDIVFFGESLPSKFFNSTDSDFSQCDLLIIMGSSLAVQPFASLIDMVDESCPRLLINREKAGQVTGLMSMMGLGGGLKYDRDDNTRDVAWLGDCDDGCVLLAHKLGWKDDLKYLQQQLSDKKNETNEEISDNNEFK